MDIVTISANGTVLQGASFYLGFRESDGLSYVKRPRISPASEGDGIPISNSLLVSGQAFLRQEPAYSHGSTVTPKQLLTVTAVDVGFEHDGPEMLIAPTATAGDDDPLLAWFPQDWRFRVDGQEVLVRRGKQFIENRRTRLLMPGLVMLHPEDTLIARRVVSDDPEVIVRASTLTVRFAARAVHVSET